MRVTESPAGGLNVSTISGRSDLARAAWAMAALITSDAEPLPFFVY